MKIVVSINRGFFEKSVIQDVSNFHFKLLTYSGIPGIYVYYRKKYKRKEVSVVGRTCWAISSSMQCGLALRHKCPVGYPASFLYIVTLNAPLIRPDSQAVQLAVLSNLICSIGEKSGY